MTSRCKQVTSSRNNNFITTDAGNRKNRYEIYPMEISDLVTSSTVAFFDGGRKGTSAAM